MVAWTVPDGAVVVPSLPDASSLTDAPNKYEWCKPLCSFFVQAASVVGGVATSYVCCVLCGDAMAIETTWEEVMVRIRDKHTGARRRCAGQRHWSTQVVGLVVCVPHEVLYRLDGTSLQLVQDYLQEATAGLQLILAEARAKSKMKVEQVEHGTLTPEPWALNHPTPHTLHYIH